MQQQQSTSSNFMLSNTEAATMEQQQPQQQKTSSNFMISNTEAATMEQQGTASHFKLSATSCGTCIVRFDSPEARRAHYKSQWHATNLKRRILELLPLTVEEHAVAAAAAAALACSTAEAAWEVLSDSDEEEDWSAFRSDDERDSDTSVSDADQDAEAAEKYYVQEECLFCNAVSDSLDDNVAHMHKAHGMFVPDRERLILDTETLVKYLHLVVRGYRECLQCGKQLRTAEAAQQHMVGKNHCRFDIAVEDSEFRDFYEEDSEDEEDATEGRKAIAGARDENGAVRLPSGKMDESGVNFLLAKLASNKDTDVKALSRRAEKLDVACAKQLAAMRKTDRAALAHLSPAELRSHLRTWYKQECAAARAQEKLEACIMRRMSKTSFNKHGW